MSQQLCCSPLKVEPALRDEDAQLARLASALGHPARVAILRYLQRLVLPNQNAVPISFHITEVALVQKTFIDCGGTMCDTKTCQLQAWVGPDEDHRIAAGKMADVLGRAASFLPSDDLELEIEYESGQISQSPVAGAQVSDEFVTLHLTTKHTACLAPEKCIVPAPKAGSIALEMAPINACGCGPSGCC